MRDKVKDKAKIVLVKFLKGVIHQHNLVGGVIYYKDKGKLRPFFRHF